MAEEFGDWRYSILFDISNGVTNNYRIMIDKYIGNGGDVVVPDTINGIPVKEVGNPWSAPPYILPQAGPMQGFATSGNYSVTSLTIPQGVSTIAGGAFLQSRALTNVTISESVTSIGRDAFADCTNITSLTLPARFVASYSSIGFSGQASGESLVQNLATVLATNQTFLVNLAQAILSASNNYGIATQSGVSNTITSVASNFVTQSQITTLATRVELTHALTQSRTDGINSVISNPNLWTLYTTNQIKAMVMGDLMLTRTNNGQFVLNYDIEQSDDLSNWTPYAGYALPLTNLPTDKAFVRIKLKNQQ